MAENKESENVCKERFNIQLVFDSFSKCAEDTSALKIEHYLIAFRELYRFFCLLGSVFSFVASDIISKVNILEDYLQAENQEKYSTIQSMIEYEVENNLTINPNGPSGSRTLLRLHRALEFIMFFMKDLSEAEKSSTSVIARKCYQDSLARYHSILIRWTASAAMSTLPEKKQFMKVVFGRCDAEMTKQCETLMANIAQISKVVYDETQKVYETKNLLDLP